MLFSEKFGIEHAETLDWFDPHLTIDTLLFVDPFLLFEDKDEKWNQSHDKIMDYFQQSFQLLAKSRLQRSHQYFKKVLALMEFPEPREFRLGFSSGKIDGSGSGKHLARLVVESMCEAIQLGTDNLDHFEELGLLVEGINKDRISDITCNILKQDFIKYTQEVCITHGVPLQSIKVPHSKFDTVRYRWLTAEWDLPVDDRSVPIILTPKRFLRELPTLNSDSWREFLNSELRDDLNFHISGNLDKARIIRLARGHPDSVQRWIKKSEENGSSSYDFDKDPNLRVNWYHGAKRLVDSEPLEYSSINTEDKLHDFISAALGKFKLYIEEQGGWRLLWNPQYDKHVPEENIQLLVKAVLDGYCHSASLLLDREVELGRGPVDFAITASRSVRTLLEIKKLENGHFWHGVEYQLPSYLKSDDRTDGWLLVVRHSDTRQMQKRWNRIPALLRLEYNGVEYTVRTVCVDGRPKKSASKIDPETLEPPDSSDR